MADERYNFSQARTRLEEIVTQVRKKDTSLEKSLDLLEEGVRLANVCTELSDHSEWRTVVEEQVTEVVSVDDPDLKRGSEADVESVASVKAEAEPPGDVDTEPVEAGAGDRDAGDDVTDEPEGDTAEEPSDA